MPELTLSFDDPSALGFVAVMAVLAGFVRGFSGFGGPAILILVLTQFYLPVTVIAKVLVMDMAASLRLQRDAFAHVQWREVIHLSVASYLGLPVGMVLLYTVEPDIARRFVAGFVALSTVAMLLGLRFRHAQGLAVWLVFGFSAGIVVGATGVALLAMLFLFSMPTSAEVSRANALSWLFAVSPGVLAAHVIGGSLDFDAAWRALAMGLFYIAGATLGARKFKGVNEALFRRIVAGLLLGLAAIAFVA